MSAVLATGAVHGDSIVFAYRWGVVQGMRMRGRVIPNQGLGYVQAPTAVCRLADRVRIEYLRRHPKDAS